MAGGGAGAGNGSEVFNGAGIDSTMVDNFGGPSPSAATPADYYSSLARPVGETITNAYNQSLGRTPEVSGETYWRNAALNNGWTNQQLAQNINAAGAPERAQTGFGGQINPQSFNTQRVATIPSYYNTNPVGVDYANIFNPAARSVTQNQQTLTPQQQANYLNAWQQDYSRTNRAATEAANLERKNTANVQWSKYLADKAKAEAAATGQSVVDKAVEEALAQQAANRYTDQSQYMTVGGKAGGSIPSGLRSLKGLTKP